MEGKTQLVGDHVRAHGGHPQADEGSQQTLVDGTLGQTDHHGDRHQAETEILPGTQQQGHIGNQSGGNGSHDNGHEGADEGTDDTDGQRPAGLAVLGHGVAVIAGGDGRGGAGNTHQHRSDEGTGDAADIHTQQHTEAHFLGQSEGHGKNQGNAQAAGQTGDGT